MTGTFGTAIMSRRRIIAPRCSSFGWLWLTIHTTTFLWHTHVVVVQADPVVDLTTPPMGFMSWERFRCQIDCHAEPLHCVSDTLYRTMAEALVTKGYAAAGYTQVSIDDCWMSKSPHGRDDITGQLQPDPIRFPHGIAALADHMHSLNLTLGIYADAGMETCAHFEGSQNHEELDAQTFAEWGVDYIKLDGCHISSISTSIQQQQQGTDHHHHNNPSAAATAAVDKYQKQYVTFGNAIRKAATTRNMVFSCSWPADIGDNETEKPFNIMYHQAGCNTWRNYKDIDNHWERLVPIILHWGDYWQDLQQIPKGSFNDADMLLAGDDHYGHVLPLSQAQVQLGFWAMIASPLFIGGDVRTISEDYRALLLNPHIIAINQDVSHPQQADCVMGCKGSTHDDDTTITVLQQVWSKSLQQGHSRALAFFNLQNTTTTTAIQYKYSVEGAVAQCVDLWATDPTQDVCAHGKGATTQHWDIQVMPQDKDDGQVWMTIRALDMEPTSHRMLRIDYFCTTSSSSSSCRDHSDAAAFS
jgi:Alpha galactosidase A/Alpha galactosidase C-terminal beta sandwich domain